MLSTANFLVRLAILGKDRLASVSARMVTNCAKLFMDTLGSNYFYKPFCWVAKIFFIWSFTEDDGLALMRKPAV